MNRQFLFWLILAAMTFPIHADEGMWLLPLLEQQKYADMQRLGLQLEAKEIYHSEDSSLKDAVVIFGSGCTGEVISSDGLILTNHHCGYEQIQQHSSIENDYLTNGFWAKTKEEELPNPGLTITCIEKIEEVTAFVKQRLAEESDTQSLYFLQESRLNQLAREKVGEHYLQNNPGSVVEIVPFYGGNQYYMFTYKIYSDVRLVGAPPSSIGKFGADTDNWMWPRHTGDFSLFRVYTDAHGNPAPYSEKNIPLHPKKWLQISLKGIQENDFVMMLGFPGSTKKYYTSWEVTERRDIDNAVRISMRELRQHIMLEEMLNDPAVRIQYSSKYAYSTNAYKNAIGTNWAINKYNFEAVKKQEQERLLAWSFLQNKEEYPKALETIRQIVSDRKDLRFQKWMLDEAILRAIEFTKVPIDIEPLTNCLKGEDQEERERQLRLFERAYKDFADKNYDPEVDKKIAKAMLKAYCRQIPSKDRPSYFAEIDKKFKGKTDDFVDYLFKESIFGDSILFEHFLHHPKEKTLLSDPMILFAQSIRRKQQELTTSLNAFHVDYALAHRSYLKGLLEMDQEKMNFPDANFTLRLTYGQIKGYSPRDAIEYSYQTTLDGVMEKEDPTNWEFIVPDRLKELYKEKKENPYSSANGKIPVAFCANTHSTGGNSGSPVLNKNGELIGINFDRNWEGVGGDIQYLPDFQRSIIVDIRYILFIIDQYAQASYLLEEMDILF